MAPQMKRPAAAGGKAAKKSKGGLDAEIMQKCDTVIEGLRSCDALPASKQAVLVSSVKHCMITYKDDRHDFDHMIVEEIGTALVGKHAAIAETVAAHQATIDGADANKAALVAAVEEAASTLEGLKIAAAEAKVPSAADAEAVKELKAAVAAAKKAADEGNADFVKLGDTKSQLEAAFTETFLPMKEAIGEPARLKALEKVCKAHDFDASMMQSALAVFKKEPEARGSFESLVISQIEMTFNDKVAGLATQLEALVPAKNERQAVVDEKEAAHSASEAKSAASQEALRNACAAEKAAGKELEAKKKALASFLPGIKKVADDLDASTKEHAEFESGPIKAYQELKEFTKPLPPPPVAQEDALPEDTSGAEKIAVKRHVYNARGGAPPFRGSYLTATDTVEILKDYSLKLQLGTLVPPSGSSAPMMFPATVMVYTSEEAPPEKWEGPQADASTEADMSKTAGDVFGAGGQAVILIPMQGMD